MPEKNQPSKVWVESLTAQLQLLDTACGHVPGGERLEVQDLNEILRLMESAKSKFLFVCELYDFKLPTTPSTGGGRTSS